MGRPPSLSVRQLVMSITSCTHPILSFRQRYSNSLSTLNLSVLGLHKKYLSSNPRSGSLVRVRVQCCVVPLTCLHGAGRWLIGVAFASTSSDRSAYMLQPVALGPVKRIEESAASQSLGPGEGLQYPEHLGYEKDLQAGLARRKM